jgi:hypothetical protein
MLELPSTPDEEELAAGAAAEAAPLSRPHITGDGGPVSGGASKAQMVTITCPDGRVYHAHAKFAEGAENGVRGLASEYLASRLAQLLGAGVPPAEVVDLPEGQEIKMRDGIIPKSGLVAASETMEFAVDVNGAEALEDIATRDLALISTLEWWTEVGDRGHNMIRSKGHAYAVDFASAFSSCWSRAQPSGGLPDDPFICVRLASEPAIMREVADVLEGVADRDIDAAVDAVPDLWMDGDAKHHFKESLKLAQRLVAGKIREKYALPNDQPA